MFVYSVKTSKGKLLGILAVVAIAIILMIIVFSGGKADAETASTKTKINTSANTAAERVQFLAQYGWEVKEEPLSVTEVLIPEEFDETYEKYNTIQKAQGMDLTKYKGKSAKKWIYEVTNYPKADSTVQATMLVLNGKVIGGDVSSDAENGFMHGFSLDSAASATVDVLYDVNEDGIIVVQGNAGIDPIAESGTSGTSGTTGTGGNTSGGGQTSGGGANDGTEGGTSGGSGGQSGDQSGTSGGQSEAESNPQTGDIWF